MIALIIVAIAGLALAANQFLCALQDVRQKRELDKDPHWVRYKNRRIRR